MPSALANSAINQPTILAALPLVSNLFRGSVPSNLGVKNQQLSPCLASPKAV
jgi:uncharacterized protein (DUF1499 family)